mmetsp:Transcript_21208/g.27390  ORF Transcript_21208/g.27390 Transcript_21208/m.27390 type:complete len:127 (-) Transcript_21208:156-536(-)|eukprot:CAMPEP_0198140644 /NCGR_PEP_ID=MMETSP1443-20131203/3786_1 /TAXON_ID=186043 /ORGANISM="Entomoneis sp., Strain CCMP2396" /LENGTH=126 /DNA_ID=CAMNT_0043803143 /DNA_START=57 /DNA_END=437 /DNA_ORIENTATION=+
MSSSAKDESLSTTLVPILYNKAAPFSGFANFDVSKIISRVDEGQLPEPVVAVEVNGTCSQVDHVFCGTQRDPDYPSMPLLHGDHFQVYGASLVILQQKDNHVTLRITHDGTSPEVLVIYATKQKNT